MLTLVVGCFQLLVYIPHGSSLPGL
jgi:hypothetical protein